MRRTWGTEKPYFTLKGRGAGAAQRAPVLLPSPRPEDTRSISGTWALSVVGAGRQPC